MAQSMVMEEALMVQPLIANPLCPVLVTHLELRLLNLI
jgi:hypothetical protein